MNYTIREIKEKDFSKTYGIDFRISNERIGSTGHDACPVAYIKKL